jgi:hypothetical protein
LDDRDPSIVYSGNAGLGGTKEEYSGTTHSLVAQSSASFKFEDIFSKLPGRLGILLLTGTYVTMFGTLSEDWGTCLVSYTIDGHLALVANNNATASGTFVFGVPFFTVRLSLASTASLAHARSPTSSQARSIQISTRST